MATTAVARETVFALRREIARIEGTLPERLEQPVSAGKDADGDAGDMVLRRCGVPAAAAMLATGSETLDAALGGGLPHAALTEIHGRQTRDAGAVAGFALGLAVLALGQAKVKAPLLWLAAGEALSEAGHPYAPGLLHRFGLAPEDVLLADVRRLEDALWVAEEAAALTGFSAVLLEVRGEARKLDLTATRRLHRRAQASRRPFFLLRQAGHAEPTAAPVRLIVAPAPAGERRMIAGSLDRDEVRSTRPDFINAIDSKEIERDAGGKPLHTFPHPALAGSIGPPAFSVEIGRSRTAIPATAVLEWNRDERAFDERPRAAQRSQDAGPVVSPAFDRPHPAGEAGARMALRNIA